MPLTLACDVCGRQESGIQVSATLSPVTPWKIEPLHVKGSRLKKPLVTCSTECRTKVTLTKSEKDDFSFRPERGAGKAEA